MNLKPCPFCGSDRIVQGERYFAMCVDCGATGPERSHKVSQNKQNEDWNTRADDARIRRLEEAVVAADKYIDALQVDFEDYSVWVCNVADAENAYRAAKHEAKESKP